MKQKLLKETSGNSDNSATITQGSENMATITQAYGDGSFNAATIYQELNNEGTISQSGDRTITQRP